MMLKTCSYQTFLLMPFFVTSIRISHIEVPRYHLEGEDLILNCTYEHSGVKPDPLYSVKWFRGVDHFYEYSPNRSPQIKSFPFVGLKVDLRRSSESSVYLTDVNEKTSGLFRCEVMGDKPFFETESANANLTVVEPPFRGPEIHGIEHNSQVRIGERISIRCSVGDSKPPANITWILNGNRYDDSDESPKIRTADSYGRSLIEKRLDLKLGQSTFVRGALHIDCLAELFDVYRRKHSIDLLDIDRPKPAGIGWWFSSGANPSTSNGMTIAIPILLVIISPPSLFH